MVRMRLMRIARWLTFASLTCGMCSVFVGACGTEDGRPGSLVSAGGDSGHGSAHAGRSGTGVGDAGLANGEAGSQDNGNDAGAAGEVASPAAPLAIFPSQLQVDVACGASADATDLVVRNGGTLPLTITSATATVGYSVNGNLPLQIAAMSSAVLKVTPAAPKASASVGALSTGHLTFVTNEPDATTRVVLLNTTLYGAKLEFTDSKGAPLGAALPLTYLSSDVCPDDVKYRIHNTGNLAFTLFGPTFPTHLGGTSAGENGRNVAPDEYVELRVGGNSAPDGACSGSGDLTFTVRGSFCGPVPSLGVSWPPHIASAGCTCAAATQ